MIRICFRCIRERIGRYGFANIDMTVNERPYGKTQEANEDRDNITIY